MFPITDKLLDCNTIKSYDEKLNSIWLFHLIMDYMRTVEGSHPGKFDHFRKFDPKLISPKQDGCKQIVCISREIPSWMI